MWPQDESLAGSIKVLEQLTMQWSKLRSRVEGLFADSVKGRVRLHSTRYRRMHDQEGRSWITIDGEEIVNMPHIFQWLSERDERAALFAGVTDLRDWRKYHHLLEPAETALRNESCFWQGDLGNAMFQYLSLSIAEIHASENPLVRAIGMLDRRTGMRTLSRMAAHNEHPQVQLLYRFRCDAEGVGNNSGGHRSESGNA